MNNAHLFESNIKRVLNDLKIIEKYSIYYETKAIVRFRTIKLEFYLGMSYDEIKNIFIENNKCYNFKKKI